MCWVLQMITRESSTSASENNPGNWRDLLQRLMRWQRCRLEGKNIWISNNSRDFHLHTGPVGLYAAYILPSFALVLVPHGLPAFYSQYWVTHLDKGGAQLAACHCPLLFSPITEAVVLSWCSDPERGMVSVGEMGTLLSYNLSLLMAACMKTKRELATCTGYVWSRVYWRFLSIAIKRQVFVRWHGVQSVATLRKFPLTP